MNWLSYWGNPPSPFASQSHKNAHYDAVANGVLRSIPNNGQVKLLDYGCGEAGGAEQLALSGVSVHLYDRSPYYRTVAESLAERVSDVHIVTEQMLEEEGSFSIVLLCSVAQYFSGDELGAHMKQFHRLLMPGGTLLLVDMILPNRRPIHEIAEMLRTAWGNGYLVALLFNFVRRWLHGKGDKIDQLRFYAHDEIKTYCHEAGFLAPLKVNNLSLNAGRVSYVVKKPERRG